jgi:hypothetical protein
MFDRLDHRRAVTVDRVASTTPSNDPRTGVGAA